MVSARTFILATFLVTSAVTVTPQEPTTEAVSVVTSVSGSATLIAPTNRKGPVSRFDWLPVGAVLTTGAGSSVTLIFADGGRYEIGEKSRITVTPGGPKPLGNSIHRLEGVPPIPRLAALAEGQHLGARSGAIRVRQGSGERVQNLYPNAMSASIPDQTSLRFSPIKGASRYRVELEDDSGKTILDLQTELTTVLVPPNILRSGSSYYWKVRTVERVGPSVHGESEFDTLSQEDLQRRAALQAVLQQQGDASSLATLADVDRRLGLWAEAREGFLAALAKAPSDAAIKKALSEVNAQLAGNNDIR
jgi:hypothetical protein